jgi:hypothetical protein
MGDDDDDDDDDDFTGTLAEALKHLNVSETAVIQYFRDREMLDALISTPDTFTSKRIMAKLGQARRAALLALHSDKTGEHRPEELHSVISAFNMVKRLYEDLPVFDVDDSSVEEADREDARKPHATAAAGPLLLSPRDEDDSSVDDVDDDDEGEEEADREDARKPHAAAAAGPLLLLPRDDEGEEEAEEVAAGEVGVDDREDARKPHAAAAAGPLLLSPRDEDQGGRHEASSSETEQGAEDQETPAEYKKYIGVGVNYGGFWFEGRVMGLHIVEEKNTKVERLCYHVVYDDGDEEDLMKREMRKLDIGSGQWSQGDKYIGATVWKEFYLDGTVKHYCGVVDEEPTFACEFKNKGEKYDRFLGISEIPLPPPKEKRSCNSTPRKKKKKRNCNNSTPRNKRRNCDICVNCKKGNCGKCKNCLDKKEFGGPNKRKQRCLEKKCLSPSLG